jgi:hypothetical protein
MTGRAAAALLTGCVLAAGTAGCASTQPAGPRPGPVRVSAVMTDIATGSGRWPAGAEQLQAAFDRLDHECLNRAGFHPPATPEASLPSPGDEAATIDLAGRRRHGYGISSSDEDSATAANPNAYTASLSPGDRQRFGTAQFGPGMPTTVVALRGKGRATVPTAGCVARARRALAGDVQTWAEISYIPQQFDDELGRRALTAPAYRTALAHWRTCMAAHGYTYATPDAAVTHLTRQHEQGATGPRFRHREITTAVTDGKCAARTHLPTTLLHARRTLAHHLPTPDLTTLRNVARSWQSTVARAQRVLRRRAGSEAG